MFKINLCSNFAKANGLTETEFYNFFGGLEGVEKEIYGGKSSTTNNQMELMAVIMGLEALKRPVSITVVSDSRYVLNGIQSWIAGWKRNGWKNAKKQPVANQELWQRLDAATQSHQIDWQWIKGHAGHPLNERCDELASAEARQF